MLEKFLIDRETIPLEVKFKDIQDFERMEERFFDVGHYFGDILGMNIDSVEFCPNDIPPSLDSEILPWLWVIHPELKDEILDLANDDLKKLIKDYEAS